MVYCSGSEVSVAPGVLRMPFEFHWGQWNLHMLSSAEFPLHSDSFTGVS